jgi:hypothetical protein
MQFCPSLDLPNRSRFIAQKKIKMAADEKRCDVYTVDEIKTKEGPK